jgi:ankyrin repeat protein
MNELDLKLLLAIQKNQPKQLTSLISKGADINVYSDGVKYTQTFGGHTSLVDGYTPLMFSVKADRSKCTEILIKKNVNMDLQSKDSTKTTALIIAAEMGNLDGVKLLIENGAKINLQDATQRTALLASVMNSREQSFEIIKYLVENGANINIQDIKGNTPLLDLIHSDRSENSWKYESILYLVEHGSNLSLANNSGKSAFLPGPGYSRLTETNRKIVNNKINFIKTYQQNRVDKCNAIIKEKKLAEQLMYAVTYSRYEMLESAVNEGADVNMVDEDGCTPLLISARTRSIKCLGLLIERGANLNYCSSVNDKKKCTTALIQAIRAKSYKCALLLINQGANVNHSDHYGLTALSIICCTTDKIQSYPIIIALIEHGADVDSQDELGNTPLMNIIKNNTILSNQDDDVEFVKLFIKNGANFLIKNSIGKSIKDLTINHREGSAVADLIVSLYEQQQLNQKVSDDDEENLYLF